MCRALKHRLAVLIGAVAITAFAIGCGTVESGTVLEVTEDSVTVADDTSFDHMTYRVAPDASVLKDGQPADLDDLEQGDDVSVTVSTDTEGNEVATVVSAESNGAAADGGDAPRFEQPLEEAPADTGAPDEAGSNVDPSMTAYQGDVMAVGDDMLTLTDPGGTQLPFIVNDQTDITIDGEPAELEAIGAGFVAIVTARQELDELVAIEIEAASPLSARDPAEEQETEGPDSEPDVGEQPELPEGPQL